jgi:hypothetical protein
MRAQIGAILAFGGFIVLRVCFGDQMHVYIDRTYAVNLFFIYWLVTCCLLPPLETYPAFIAWRRRLGLRWSACWLRACCCGCGRKLCGDKEAEDAAQTSELAAFIAGACFDDFVRLCANSLCYLRLASATLRRQLCREPLGHPAQLAVFCVLHGPRTFDCAA